MARAIGMTSHTDGAVLAQAIERHPLDCTQMALNPSGTGEFEKTALAAANKKGLGVIAMKVYGQEFLIGTEGGKQKRGYASAFCHEPARHGGSRGDAQGGNARAQHRTGPQLLHLSAPTR